jgi:ribosome-binding protein aMBF1 (putative translation factor)
MNKEIINPVLICDGCGCLIDPDNGDTIIDTGEQNVCQRCFDYLNSDEYLYDLKDRDGESRYEQNAGK